MDISIYKKFPSFKLELVDIRINKGITFISGNIAQGKSTMLKSISGVIKSDFETDKDVCYTIDLKSFGKTKIKDIITIYESRYHTFKRTFFLDELKKFDIESYHKINTLSKGNQKIVSVLLTLATQLEVLCIDEPFAFLSPRNRETMIQTFITHNSNDKYVLIASHSIEEMDRISDYVLRLNKGLLQYHVPVSDIKTSLVEHIKNS